MCKKISSIIITTCFTLLLLSGCNTSEKIDGISELKSEDELIIMEEPITEKSDKDNDIEYKKIMGKNMEFPKSIKIETFFKDINNLKKTVSEDDTTWEGEDKSYLYCEDGRILYNTKKYEDYSTILFTSEGFRDDFDEICNGATISEGSPEEAIAVMENIVKENGIPTANPKAYALTKDVLTKLSKMFMSDEEYQEYLKDNADEPMKREFAKEDEAYLVLMDVCADSYILYNKELSLENGELSTYGSVVWAIIQKDFVIAFSADGIYNIDKKTTSINHVITREDAVDMLNKKYKDDINKSGIKCRNVKVKYAPLMKRKASYTFVPVYVFTLTYEETISKGNKKETVQVKETVLLDAEEGIWIE